MVGPSQPLTTKELGTTASSVRLGDKSANVASRSGFEGCLSSVDIADLSPSLTEDAVVPSSLVVSGCEGPTKCSQNACANRGTCVQQWNAYACECDMTSFTGPTCYDGEEQKMKANSTRLHICYN